jgi:O-antigen/teichoic acid export membrane protein
MAERLEGDAQPTAPPQASAIEPEPPLSPDVGTKVVRGGAVRIGGYAAGMLLTAAASIFLLRHLGVSGFGRYMTVVSLIAIVGGVTEAGLSAVGGRDLAVRAPGVERSRLLANLLGMRLALTPVGVLLAIVFAVAVGYGRTIILGTLLAGVGLILTSTQGTMALPLAVELRIGSLTALDVLRQAAMLAGIGVLVAASASLLPFFAMFIAVGAIVLAVTPLFLRSSFVWRPVFDRQVWTTLVREALPVAVSVVIAVFYFRLVMVLTSLLTSATQTGLFAISFRVVEILYGLAALIATTALPVLAVAAQDRTRLAYILHRMVEVALIAACYLVIVVIIVAKPVLELLGGPQYGAAAAVLRIEVLALIPVFFAQVCQLALVSLRRQTALAIASGLALLVALTGGLALIPVYDAKGAAVAAVAAEVALALVLLVVLVRSNAFRGSNFSFLWKVGAASALAAALAFLTGLPQAAGAVVATVAYGAVLLLTRAVPREVIDGLVLRRSG